jgi:hypothetical protein
MPLVSPGDLREDTKIAALVELVDGVVPLVLVLSRELSLEGRVRLEVPVVVTTGTAFSPPLNR